MSFGNNWIPVVWDMEGDTQSGIQIHRMDSPEYEGIRYAVRNGRLCLSVDSLEWDYEPSPSSRDKTFYELYRFKSFEDAVTAVAKLMTKKNPGENMCNGLGQCQ